MDGYEYVRTSFLDALEVVAEEAAQLEDAPLGLREAICGLQIAGGYESYEWPYMTRHEAA
jgi:hypothetical protein